MIHTPFSVLMSLYDGEKAAYFNRAMESIWDEQSVCPNEILLVQDGPLDEEKYKAIESWKNKLGDVLKIIPLEDNIGLGNALSYGLNQCGYELVARMDTDDIALQDRFEKQLNVLKNLDVDVCSSWVSEFNQDENEVVSCRTVPETHDEIIKYSRTRNGINHPAVMYKKTSVINAGGYRKMLYFEDYYLWARMIMNGAKFYNIQEPLVNMRAGYGQLTRRSGVKYASHELVFLKKLLEIGFINRGQFVKNISIRTTARILPKVVLKNIYALIRGN